jgi:hypothetical protein
VHAFAEVVGVTLHESASSSSRYAIAAFSDNATAGQPHTTAAAMAIDPSTDFARPPAQISMNSSRIGLP